MLLLKENNWKNVDIVLVAISDKTKIIQLSYFEITQDHCWYIYFAYVTPMLLSTQN